MIALRRGEGGENGGGRRRAARRAGGVARALADGRGFTLLEILVALFIFGTVLAAIYAAYGGTFRLIGATRDQAEIYQMARVAMERIGEDLAAAIPPGPPEPEAEAEAGAGAGEVALAGVDEVAGGMAADTLRFRSLAHVALAGARGAGGPAVISYTVQPAAEGGGLVLYREDRPEAESAGGEGGRGYVLCDRLAGVNFTYYAEGGEEYDHWDTADPASQGRLPARVAVELQFQAGNGDTRPLKFRTAVVLPARGERQEE